MAVLLVMSISQNCFAVTLLLFFKLFLCVGGECRFIQNLQKEYIELPCTFHPDSPILAFLSQLRISCGHMSFTLQQFSVYFLNTWTLSSQEGDSTTMQSKTPFRFHRSSSDILCRSRLYSGSYTQHLFSSALQSGIVPQSFLSFMTMAFLKNTGHIVCVRNAHQLGLSGVSS